MPKPFKFNTSTPLIVQVVSLWPANTEAWFRYTEADFYEHAVTGLCVQFLAELEELTCELIRQAVPSLFISNASETLLHIQKGYSSTRRPNL